MSIPSLDPSGNSWAIIVFCFQDAVKAKGFWEPGLNVYEKPLG